MRHIYMALLALSMICWVPAASYAGPVEDLSALQKGIKSLQADFQQKKNTELLPRPVISSGTFYYKEGAGVRWEYVDEMVVIYDNKTLYLYYIELGEAEKVEGIAGFNGPLSFNVRDLIKDYDITGEKSVSGEITLTLLPKTKMPFSSMLMFFHKGVPFPYEVKVRDDTGDETSIKFHTPELNTELKKGLFVFNPPKGVKVTERKFQ